MLHDLQETQLLCPKYKVYWNECCFVEIIVPSAPYWGLKRLSNSVTSNPQTTLHIARSILFSLFTHKCFYIRPASVILAFGHNTSMIGLISSSSEMTYGDEGQHLWVLFEEKKSLLFLFTPMMRKIIFRRLVPIFTSKENVWNSQQL